MAVHLYPHLDLFWKYANFEIFLKTEQQIITRFDKYGRGVENTRDKNENIHLWLLELIHKKDRTRLLDEANLEVSGVPVSILNHPQFNDDKPHKVEVNNLSFVENSDLNLLLKEKTGLEEEMRRSDEEIKALRLRVRRLCERIIQETKKKNIEKRLEIERWRSKIGTLETQIGGACLL